MKAKVYVSLKSGVLDPQGKAIQHSVELLGYAGISDVRQGKYIELDLTGLAEDKARAEVDRQPDLHRIDTGVSLQELTGQVDENEPNRS